MNTARSGSTSAAKDAWNFALSRDRRKSHSAGGGSAAQGAPGGGSLMSEETDFT